MVLARQPGVVVGRVRLQPSSCASEWPCLWVIPPRELLLTACSRGEQLSFSVWLLLLWSWTACCYHAGGTACLVPLPKKKKNEKGGVKINSSLNKFVKAASKGVQHLLCHSCQFDATLRMWRVTWQIACMPAEEEGVAFVLLLTDRWVMARRRTNHNANQ